jgi:hypothetical protein
MIMRQDFIAFSQLFASVALCMVLLLLCFGG